MRKKVRSTGNRLAEKRGKTAKALASAISMLEQHDEKYAAEAPDFRRTTLEEEFAKRATQEAGGGKALMPTVFSRFYCEVLFRHFDEDNSGTLDEVEGRAFLRIAGVAKADVSDSWASMLHSADKNGDVNISKDEFMSYVPSRSFPLSLSLSVS